MYNKVQEQRYITSRFLRILPMLATIFMASSASKQPIIPGTTKNKIKNPSLLRVNISLIT